MNHLLITASAGTGKTYQLSNRYLKLLATGVEPSHMLATTFTRKAAGEILDRILLRLSAAVKDSHLCAELAGALELPKLDQTKCGNLLLSVVRSLHRLEISTLDSYMGQIARCYSLELGLPTGWEIVDETEDLRLRDEAIYHVISSQKPDDLLALVHLLTKGEARRGIAQLIQEEVKFLYTHYRQTNAAVWASVPRVDPLKTEQLEEALEALRTLELPQHKPFRKAWQQNYDDASAENWGDFLKLGITPKIAAGAETYYRVPLDEPLVTCYERLIRQAAAVQLRQLADQTEGTFHLLQHFDRFYSEIKQQRGALRFDDITFFLARVASSPSKRLGDFRLTSRTEHLLLDEFQDTSLLQWQSLRPLAGRVTEGSRGSFFCVGDTKQAIYSWRGGDARIFDSLPKELPDLTTEVLDKSYRSAPAVIETVNQIFTKLDQHPGLAELSSKARQWCESFPTQQAAKASMPGYACLQTSPLSEAREQQVDTTRQFAAEETARLARQSPDASIALLVRTNDVIGDLVNRIHKLGLPASGVGGNPLTDSAAVQVLISLLQLADHPGDTTARFHLQHSPFAEPLELSTEEDARRLSREVRTSLLEHGYGLTIYRWAQQLLPACGARETRRLCQFIEVAYAYQARATLRCDDFVKLIQTERVADPGLGHIQVMTIHQSKGLEFDIVVLPELDFKMSAQSPVVVVDRPDATAPIRRVCRHTSESVQQLLPEDLQQVFADDRAQTFNEMLCNLYVAITRAVHSVHMIVSPTRPTKSKPTFPKTAAGLLRAALVGTEAVSPEETLYELGQRDWYRETPLGQPASTGDAEQPMDLPREGDAKETDLSLHEPSQGGRDSGALAKLPAIRLAPIQGPPLRGRVRTSPSALEGGQQQSLSSLLQAKSSAGMRWGTLQHTWLEQVVWLDEGIPDELSLRKIGQQLHVAEPEIDRALGSFHQVLKQASVRSLLDRREYAEHLAARSPFSQWSAVDRSALRYEVMNERTFMTSFDDVLCHGSIDRLVLIFQASQLVAAEVIDWKTDRIAPDDSDSIDEKVAFYTPQLAAYQQAVAAIYHLPEEQVSGQLVLIGADKVISINR